MCQINPISKSIHMYIYSLPVKGEGYKNMLLNTLTSCVIISVINGLSIFPHPVCPPIVPKNCGINPDAGIYECITDKECLDNTHKCCRTACGMECVPPKVPALPPIKPFPPLVEHAVCRQPKETGLCRGSFPRWYYDSKKRTCKNFIFGGCGGNKNNFRTQKECLKKCKKDIPPILPPIFPPVKSLACLQPKKAGPCEAAIPRWYYNPKSNKCELFNFGGCDPNENNFNTKTECIKRCKEPVITRPPPILPPVMPPIKQPVCLQPKEVGPCRASVLRWYYNSQSKRCGLFIFGGCGGNRNNFKTKMECTKRCKGPVVPIPPPIFPPPIFPPVLPPIKRPSVCSQPKKVGPCKAAFRRWFYNTHSGKCEKFIFGGCRGNGNNFRKQSDCEKICAKGVTPVPPIKKDPVCKLPKKVGPCRARLRRWYFNSNVGECQLFNYGGCRGNRNNFRTKAQCSRRCNKLPPLPPIIKPIDRCIQPKKVGVCRARIPKYYFNPIRGVCELFFYGGCGGNNNNFRTLSDCIGACSGRGIHFVF